MRRKLFVFEVRDLWPELPREMGVITNPVILKLMDWLEWLSYRSANGCIGLSPGIVKGIERRGVKTENIRLIPNGCDLELYGVCEPEHLEDANKDQLVVFYSGTHGIANGLDSILDVAKELKTRQVKNIRLVFIGDGMLKAKLKQRAKDEALDACLFLDSVPKKKLARYLKGADIGLQSLANFPAFYHGTSPNKFFDYIATGLPVVINYPGWLADKVKDNKCGFAVPPEDPVALAEVLEYAANHRDELIKFGKNARRLAENEFSRADFSTQCVDFLEEIAGKGGLEKTTSTLDP